MTSEIGRSATLIAALGEARAYQHPVREIEVVETHISWVVLTGYFAYKIKKPVYLDFLDFSTLDKREHYCREELRLNRRLAPELYIEIVPIVGSVRAPVVGGSGTAFEYAVRMKQFPRGALLSQVLDRGELRESHLLTLADTVAQFHANAAIAPAFSPYGTAQAILGPALENFTQIARYLPAHLYDDTLAAIDTWSRAEFERLSALINRRRDRGCVRECHGDLHLGNIALIDDRPIPFDCIEFNPNLRWIDVQSETAFLVMDLEDRGQRELANVWLNRYLEQSGDYAGLAVFGFYRVYRAVVRAKVAAIRAAEQPTPRTEADALYAAYRRYIDLAYTYIRASSPRLVIMHGVSGAGKSVLATQVARHLGAIRLRSDLERKRLYASAAGGAIDAGRYAADATRVTYQRLEELAGAVIGAGYSVVVDATFLQQWQRTTFRALAQRCGVPLTILSCAASDATLRRRVRIRTEHGGDPSEANLAVLEHQLKTRQPLDAAETAFAIPLDTEAPDWQARALRALERRQT